MKLLEESAALLQKEGIVDATRSAEELLAHVLGIKRANLYLQETLVTNRQKALFQKLLRRRLKREPLEYILGAVFFYNCTINVNKSVLIPRPETEQMVEYIVHSLQKENIKGKVLCDLCTGSGAIAIALKKALLDLTVIATDISKKALKMAQKNAEQNGVKIIFKHGDFLKALEGKVNFITCNPPYVAQNEYEKLEKELFFEPKKALVAKHAGFYFYEKFANEAPQFLQEGGHAFLEIGATQGEKLKQIFLDEQWCQKKILQDWSGRDRFLHLRNT